MLSFSFIFLLLPFFSFSQSNQLVTTDTLLAKAYQNKGNGFLANDVIDSALVYFSKASSIFEASRNWENCAYSELSLSVCHFYLSSFDSSEVHLKQVSNIAAEHAITNEDLLMNANNLLSILYSVKGDYNRAIETVLTDVNRIQSKEELTNYDSSTVANYFNSLGAWYSMKEDYNRALDYLLKTLSFYEKMNVELKEIALTYENIARVYRLKGAFRSSNKYFKKMANLVSLPSYANQYEKIKKDAYNGLASSFRHLEQLDSALYYAKQAIPIARDYGEVLANVNLGQIYLSLKKPEQAIPFFLRAEDLNLSEERVEESYILYTYNDLGDACLMQKRYSNALDYYQKSLVKNVDDFEEKDWKKNPPLSGISRPDLFLTSIHQKARTIALLSNEPEHLKLALSTYRTCINWIDSMRNNIVSEGSQLFWRNKVRDVYGEAIEVAHRLYEIDQQSKYLELAFTFSEKSKSMLLLEERKASEGKYKGAVPDSLIQKEKDLKIDIAFFQKALRKEKEEQKVKRYQQFLSDSRLALSGLKEQIEREYPEVALSKKTNFTNSLNRLRSSSLNDGSILIEYFMTQRGLYAFMISDSQEAFIQLGEREVVRQKIRTFTQQLLNPESMNANAQQALVDYDQAAFDLYEMLLAPLMSKIPDDSKRLYIIPDGPLNNIPFEALTQSTLKEPSTDFGKLNYLGKSLSVSYAYSAKFLEENLSNKATLQTNQLCLATAPQYLSGQPVALRSAEKMSRGELAALEGTAREIKAISQYFSGKFSSGEEATKSDFLAQINEYGILHLATHGVADYENPGFAHFLFSSDGTTEEERRLYHYEVANLDLQAQLAVLSACETGQGKYEEGEGVFSLARGFMQAGVPSVVMSLWKVNDLSTSELMPHFYKGLSEGLAIDQALKMAKQTYLENASLRFRHPYYWAGFVVLGDPHELGGGQNTSLLFWGIGGLVLLLIGFLLWKAKREKIS